MLFIPASGRNRQCALQAQVDTRRLLRQRAAADQPRQAEAPANTAIDLADIATWPLDLRERVLLKPLPPPTAAECQSTSGAGVLRALKAAALEPRAALQAWGDQEAPWARLVFSLASRKAARSQARGGVASRSGSLVAAAPNSLASGGVSDGDQAAATAVGPDGSGAQAAKRVDSRPDAAGGARDGDPGTTVAVNAVARLSPAAGATAAKAAARAQSATEGGDAGMGGGGSGGSGGSDAIQGAAEEEAQPKTKRRRVEGAETGSTGGGPVAHGERPSAHTAKAGRSNTTTSIEARKAAKLSAEPSVAPAQAVQPAPIEPTSVPAASVVPAPAEAGAPASVPGNSGPGHGSRAQGAPMVPGSPGRRTVPSGLLKPRWLTQPGPQREGKLAGGAGSRGNSSVTSASAAASARPACEAVDGPPAVDGPSASTGVAIAASVGSVEGRAGRKGPPTAAPNGGEAATAAPTPDRAALERVEPSAAGPREPQVCVVPDRRTASVDTSDEAHVADPVQAGFAPGPPGAPLEGVPDSARTRPDRQPSGTALDHEDVMQVRLPRWRPSAQALDSLRLGRYQGGGLPAGALSEAVRALRSAARDPGGCVQGPAAQRVSAPAQAVLLRARELCFSHSHLAKHGCVGSRCSDALKFSGAWAPPDETDDDDDVPLVSTRMLAPSAPVQQRKLAHSSEKRSGSVVEGRGPVKQGAKAAKPERPDRARTSELGPRASGGGGASSTSDGLARRPSGSLPVTAKPAAAAAAATTAAPAGDDLDGDLFDIPLRSIVDVRARAPAPALPGRSSSSGGTAAAAAGATGTAGTSGARLPPAPGLTAGVARCASGGGAVGRGGPSGPGGGLNLSSFVNINFVGRKQPGAPTARLAAAGAKPAPNGAHLAAAPAAARVRPPAPQHQNQPQPATAAPAGAGLAAPTAQAAPSTQATGERLFLWFKEGTQMPTQSSVEAAVDSVVRDPTRRPKLLLDYGQGRPFVSLAFPQREDARRLEAMLRADGAALLKVATMENVKMTLAGPGVEPQSPWAQPSPPTQPQPHVQPQPQPRDPTPPPLRPTPPAGPAPITSPAGNPTSTAAALPVPPVPSDTTRTAAVRVAVAKLPAKLPAKPPARPAPPAPAAKLGPAPGTASAPAPGSGAGEAAAPAEPTAGRPGSEGDGGGSAPPPPAPPSYVISYLAAEAGYVYDDEPMAPWRVGGLYSPTRAEEQQQQQQQQRLDSPAGAQEGRDQQDGQREQRLDGIGVPAWLTDGRPSSSHPGGFLGPAAVRRGQDVREGSCSRSGSAKPSGGWSHDRGDRQEGAGGASSSRADEADGTRRRKSGGGEERRREHGPGREPRSESERERDRDRQHEQDRDRERKRERDLNRGRDRNQDRKGDREHDRERERMWSLERDREHERDARGRDRDRQREPERGHGGSKSRSGSREAPGHAQRHSADGSKARSGDPGNQARPLPGRSSGSRSSSRSPAQDRATAAAPAAAAAGVAPSAGSTEAGRGQEVSPRGTKRRHEPDEQGRRDGFERKQHRDGSRRDLDHGRERKQHREDGRHYHDPDSNPGHDRSAKRQQQHPDGDRHRGRDRERTRDGDGDPEGLRRVRWEGERERQHGRDAPRAPDDRRRLDDQRSGHSSKDQAAGHVASRRLSPLPPPPPLQQQPQQQASALGGSSRSRSASPADGLRRASRDSPSGEERQEADDTAGGTKSVTASGRHSVCSTRREGSAEPAPDHNDAGAATVDAGSQHPPPQHQEAGGAQHGRRQDQRSQPLARTASEEGQSFLAVSAENPWQSADGTGRAAGPPEHCRGEAAALAEAATAAAAPGPPGAAAPADGTSAGGGEAGGEAQQQAPRRVARLPEAAEGAQASVQEEDGDQQGDRLQGASRLLDQESVRGGQPLLGAGAGTGGQPQEAAQEEPGPDVSVGHLDAGVGVGVTGAVGSGVATEAETGTADGLPGDELGGGGDGVEEAAVAQAQSDADNLGELLRGLPTEQLMAALQAMGVSTDLVG